MGFDITQDTISKRVRKLAAAYPNATEQALLAEGFRIIGRAVELTPVEFGVLRRTGTAKVDDSKPFPSVLLGFGTDYGIFVHEDLDAMHTTGQAKFLATPFNAAQSGLLQRLATDIERRVRTA